MLIFLTYLPIFLKQTTHYWIGRQANKKGFCGFYIGCSISKSLRKFLDRIGKNDLKICIHGLEFLIRNRAEYECWYKARRHKIIDLPLDIPHKIAPKN